MSPEEKRTLTARVLTAVAEAWIQTGECVHPSDVAPGLQLSERKVREALSSSDEVDEVEESRPSFSKSYRMMQTGYHKVKVYRPSRAYLRKLILGLRAPSPAGEPK